MTGRLINVRLDADRLRKARALRARGIVLSDLVREAIDARFARLGIDQEPFDANAAITRLFEQHPDPDGLPPREYDVADRRAARAAIRKKLAQRAP